MELWRGRKAEFKFSNLNMLLEKGRGNQDETRLSMDRDETINTKMRWNITGKLGMRHPIIRNPIGTLLEDTNGDISRTSR